MAIERLTPTVGIPILEPGTIDWGIITNESFDLIDSAFLADRDRIAALETTEAILPLAIAGRVGHNIVRNNIFGLGTSASLGAQPISWLAQFENGAVGNSTRDSSTFLVGTHSYRLSIASVDTSPSAQTRPWPGFPSDPINIVEPDDISIPVSTTDPRQLTNGFGYAFQTLTLSAKTTYTLSSYGKAEIPNLTLGINCHWKIGVVFRDASNKIIHSHFSPPQVNRTNNVATDSFARAELTFTTPDIPVVTAEVWMVVEGSVAAGIGSAWFDGVQLEQTTKATFLETFSMDDGNLFVDGNLVVAGNLALEQENLVFDSQQVTFTGNVQIGDNINEDTLDVFTKSSIFHGPLSVQGDTVLGDDATDATGDLVDVVANKTTFFDNGDASNPQGGNVCIQGNLDAYGDVTLGDDPTKDTVTLNALLVTVGSNLNVVDDLTVGGFFTVERGVRLGSNFLSSPLDTLEVLMQGGSCFQGDVRFKDNFILDGYAILGNSLTDTVLINAGTTTLQSLQVNNALQVDGYSFFNIGNGSGDDFVVKSNQFDIAATAGSSLDTPLLNISGNLTLAGGNTASINTTNTSFATGGSPLTTFNVFATTSTFSGDFNIGGSLDVDGDITAQGTNFVFGDALSLAPSGEMRLGRESEITGDTYDDILRVFAGTTHFGDFGTQRKGNVHIGGDLLAAGDVTLGSSTVEDTLLFRGNEINIEVGASNLNIGGGFQGGTFDPLDTDHGGVSIDNNGNLAMDGKLTVKGPFDPTSIIISPLQADGYNTPDAIIVSSPASSPTTTFRLTSEGTINAAQALVIADGYAATINNTATNFGTISTPLLSFNVCANSTSFCGDLDVDGTLTAGPLNATDTVLDGDLNVNGALVVRDSIVSNGSNFAFGGAPNIFTTFDVRANTINLGIDGYDVGNVIVGNDLSVRNDFFVGFPTQYDNIIQLNAFQIDIDVASDRPGGLELAGFRVGGGFQDNVFDASVLDHGGVTIDAYGNIFADGSIFQKGALGFDSLTLTTPVGGDPADPLLTVVNNSTGDGYQTLFIDGYGNIETEGYVESETLQVNNYAAIDGYLCLNGTNLDDALPGTGLGLGSGGTSSIVFKIDRLDPEVLYQEYSYGQAEYGFTAERTLDIDDLGNLRTSGFLYTEVPGRSNLSTVSVTVGDGVLTFGDFNQAGPVNAFLDPINQAVDFLTSRGTGGTIFVKAGTYNLGASGLLLPDNVSLIGEGDATVLDTSVFYGLAQFGITLYGQGALSITCGSNCRVSKLKIFNSLTGIRVPSSSSNVIIEDVTINGTNIGVLLEGSDNKVIDCRIFDSVAAGLTTSVGIRSVGDQNIMKNNRVTDPDTGSEGIKLEVGSDRNIARENYLLVPAGVPLTDLGTGNITSDNIT